MNRPWPLRLVMAGLPLFGITWLSLGALLSPFGNPLRIPEHLASAMVTLLIAVGGLALVAAWVGLPIRLAARLQQGLMSLTAYVAPDPGARWWAYAQRAATPDRLAFCLHRAARWHHPDGRLEEALSFMDGAAGSGGAEAGARLLGRLAQEGSAEAAFYYAEALRWGRGQSRDLQAALRWFRRSAEGGYGPAAAWLAQAYQAGDGVDPDPQQAEAWSRSAALASPAPARGMSRRMREEGPSRLDSFIASGVKASEDLGDAVIQTSAGKTLVLGVALFGALGAIALVLALGLGGFGGITSLVFFPPMLMLLALAVKLRRSNRWSFASRQLQARAEQGNAEACFQQGRAFETGSDSHPRDASEARRWYRRAAEAGHVEAAFRLGELWAWGQGGFKDLVQARQWLSQAAAQGHAAAAARLADLDRSAADADR
jgi:TPR repeat protein